jgi:hypothetical protein
LIIIFLGLINLSYSENAYARNTLVLDFGPMIKFLALEGWGLGATYEFTLPDSFSVAASLNYGTYSIGTNKADYLFPQLEVYFYFDSTAPAGPWVAIGGEYFASYIDKEWGGIFGITGRIGFNWLSDEFRGFLLAPYIGYTFSLEKNVQVGLDFGAKLGYAF